MKRLTRSAGVSRTGVWTLRVSRAILTNRAHRRQDCEGRKGGGRSDSWSIFSWGLVDLKLLERIWKKSARKGGASWKHRRGRGEAGEIFQARGETLKSTTAAKRREGGGDYQVKRWEKGKGLAVRRGGGGSKKKLSPSSIEAR